MERWMNCFVGALLWVKLESEVRLRVPEHRDSIFTQVTQGFNWALGTGNHFHAVLFPMGAGSGRRGWMRQDTTWHLEEQMCDSTLHLHEERGPDKKPDCLALDDLFQIPSIKHAILVHHGNKNPYSWFGL